MKQTASVEKEIPDVQPPSGGCVLKLKIRRIGHKAYAPAAFRRLCVETPASLRLTLYKGPAAFRRLCVETIVDANPRDIIRASRLQAAVC